MCKIRNYKKNPLYIAFHLGFGEIDTQNIFCINEKLKDDFVNEVLEETEKAEKTGKVFRISELGFGLNPSIREFYPSILTVGKTWETVHVAIGDGLCSKTKAPSIMDVGTKIDLVFHRPTIIAHYLNKSGKWEELPIMEKGKSTSTITDKVPEILPYYR